jgi:tripartite-type tricarboxylate transporter receptor subunit TctC
MKQKGWKRGKMIFELGFLFIFAPVLSFAQPYPTKPINLIVTFAPGGTLDVSTRILASKAEKFLGQPLVVLNVGGGGGSVALGQVHQHGLNQDSSIAFCPL